MRRIVLLTLAFVFCLLWAEVKVEKVLETKSVKEYNQWVRRNKAKYASLEPIYINLQKTQEPKRVSSYSEVMNIERTIDPPVGSHYTSEYKIFYYDESGNLKKTQIEGGYISAWLYDNFHYIGIMRRDHPMYPSRSIFTLKDTNGKSVFPPDLDIPYVNPTEIGLFIEYPISTEGGSGKNPTTRIFSSDGHVFGTLQNVWTVDRVIVSPDSQFLALYVLETDNSNGTLILLSENGEELWRKTFSSPFEIDFSNNQKLIVGEKGKVKILDISGNLIHTYDAFNAEPNPISKFVNGDDYLVTSLGSEIHFYDNNTRKKIWQLRVPDSARRRGMFISNDGAYTIIIYNSHNVYVVDNKNGAIVKTFNVPLGEEERYKKEVIDSEIVVKKYKKPFGNWKCNFISDHLIFRKKSIDKKERELIKLIIYKIDIN